MLLSISASCRPSSTEGSYLVACPGAFDVVLHPATTTLSIGQSVSCRAEFGEPANCEPPVSESAENWRWASTNTDVLQVDSLGGVLTAIAAGNTIVLVRNVRLPNLVDSIAFTVRQ